MDCQVNPFSSPPEEEAKNESLMSRIQIASLVIATLSMVISVSSSVLMAYGYPPLLVLIFHVLTGTGP